MVKTQARCWIQATPQSVYDFVVLDFARNYPRWSPEVCDLQVLTPGPLRPGWRARQTRVDQGRRTQSEFEVIQLEPGHRISFQGIHDPYRIDFSIEADGRFALVTFTFELFRLSLPLRPFEKLIRLVVQDGVERTVRNLKTLVEQEKKAVHSKAEPPPQSGLTNSTSRSSDHEH